VKARVTSEPKVVGSIPTGGESCRSSAVERWTVSGRLFPPQKMPGWRGEELLRLSNDAWLWPRYSDRLFLPAKIWPARTADQSAARAGAGEKSPDRVGMLQSFDCACIQRNPRSWTWCRAGLLRLLSGRLWVRFPPGRCGPVAQWIEHLMSLTGCSRPAVFRS